MALVSRKHNFIFIHIYKCAGNSVRRMLGAPSIGSQEDRLGGEEIHGLHACISDVKKHFHSNNQKEFYDSAYKFSVVRNPFSWLVSLYRYIRNSKIHEFHDVVSPKNFFQFLVWYTEEAMHLDKPYGANKYMKMHEFLYDNGNNEMDIIVHTESINKEMRKVYRQIGLPFDTVPMVNVSRGKKPWQDYYTIRCRNYVENKFGEDLNIFGYTFGGLKYDRGIQ